MVCTSGDKAVTNANRFTTNRVGMCLQYTRTWLEIPSANPDAIAAWNTAKRKHVNGRDKDAQSPPRGAPVFWAGGSSGHGHIALAVSNSFGRSTDTKSSGKVSTADGDWWRLTWGLRYLGWTEDLNGVDIPYLRAGGVEQWRGGAVYVGKLSQGQQNSDSVSRLCWRLMHHRKLPKDKRPPRQSDDYGKQLQQAARYWQRQVRPELDGPKDGKSWSNRQAEAIFGARYTVIKEK